MIESTPHLVLTAHELAERLTPIREQCARSHRTLSTWRYVYTNGFASIEAVCYDCSARVITTRDGRRPEGEAYSYPCALGMSATPPNGLA